MNKRYEAVVVGAGAAGLMCGLPMGKRGKRTLIIERSKNIAEKIRISGGGRCNFTNLSVTQDNFLSQNPHFAISALKKFTQDDFIKMVENNDISYYEKTLGQLFCDKSSKQIINMFLDGCKKYDVTIETETEILTIEKIADEFFIKSSKGAFKSKSLIVATGGLSIPKMGATDFGYKIAKQFGLKIIFPRPALVPLTFSKNLLEKTKELAGISAFCEVSIGKKVFLENVLFTHKGISGPAILQISSYWHKNQTITINFSPKIDIYDYLIDAKQQNLKQDVANSLSNLLPKKLINYILLESKISGILANLSKRQIQIISNNINSYQIIPDGTEGFVKAEVTIGGVDSNEISSKTFESKKIKNLYFIGEVLDVTGHLGGYNFQWAWSSGFVAGNYA